MKEREICYNVRKRLTARCWERAREKNLVMETTEQFWWKTRANRGETTPGGVRGREHPFAGLREKKNSSADIFGRNLDGRRVREGSRSRGRRDESSSTCTPGSTCASVSTCRSSKEEQEGVHRRVQRRKESGKSEKQEKEGENEKEKRKELEMVNVWELCR